ncbi:hypothetical protein LINPERPRIM_LOCUS13233 [Linum perenne]
MLSVLEAGRSKLKSAMVTQFLDIVPPMRVIRSMINRLWGYEGEVLPSILTEGFFFYLSSTWKYFVTGF